MTKQRLLYYINAGNVTCYINHPLLTTMEIIKNSKGGVKLFYEGVCTDRSISQGPYHAKCQNPHKRHMAMNAGFVRKLLLIGRVLSDSFVFRGLCPVIKHHGWG